jgi:hypothetical protein
MLPRVAESRARGIGVLRKVSEGYNVATLSILRALKGKEGYLL